MISVRSTIAVFSILLFSHGVSATGNTLTVSCSIESEGFLSDTSISKLTEAYILSDVPTQEGGRHLLYQNSRHELWVKTHGYLRQGGELKINAFSVVHIDKQAKQMSEAVSSAGTSPKYGELLVHGLSDQMALSNRLVVSCLEVLN